MRKTARVIATVLATLVLEIAWASGPAGQGGPAPFAGNPSADLGPAADAWTAVRRAPGSRAAQARLPGPGAKTMASGLFMSGRFTYAFDAGSAAITLDRINNDTLSMTGALRLDLWAVATRPVRAAGFGGYRLASFSTLPSLLPRTNYGNLTRTAAFIAPPGGSYWVVLTLSEWDPGACPAEDHFCLEDSLVSDDLEVFATPAPTVTLLAANSPLCLENIPVEVAAELQRQAPGVYIPYPANTGCSTFGLRFFAGYLAGSDGAVPVYTDNATNAALLCASHHVVDCTVGIITGAFTDLWWNPNEPGWGVSITQHASGVAFVAWFTYDAAGNPKWYVVSNCPMVGARCTGTLHETTGPPFGPTFEPSQVVARSVGSLVLTFTSQDSATMTYELNGQVGSKALSRQPF